MAVDPSGTQYAIAEIGLFNSDPVQDQPVTSIWVRCDVTSGACEQAPIPTSNGTSAVMDW